MTLNGLNAADVGTADANVRLLPWAVSQAGDLAVNLYTDRSISSADD